MHIIGTSWHMIGKYSPWHVSTRSYSRNPGTYPGPLAGRFVVPPDPEVKGNMSTAATFCCRPYHYFQRVVPNFGKT